MINLDELEERIRRLFEDRLVAILPGRKAGEHLAGKIAAGIREQVKLQAGEGKTSPDVFVVIAHSTKIEEWQKNNRLVHDLLGTIDKIHTEYGLKFNAKPRLSFAADISYGEDEVKVVASYSKAELQETRRMESPDENSDQAEPGACSPYFIIHETQVYPIEGLVMNIGRRLGNDLVIDDGHVSRNHAQIRVINRQCHLFDLDSAGGTFINGKRISQAILQAGDVISLAGVALVFGCDGQDTGDNNLETQPSTGLEILENPTANPKQGGAGK